MDKNKLKRLLDLLSTSEEKDQLRELEMQMEADKKLDAILDSFEKSINASKEANLRVSRATIGSFEGFVDKLGEKLDELKGTITTSFVQNKPINAAPAYKDIINQLSAVKESIDKKPVPVWNWPQYASVGVRNKDFSNIDPAQSYANATTTPSIPYGTLLVYDNAGTIAKVSNTAGLPVSLASTALAGLDVTSTPSSVGDGTVNLTTAGTAQQVSTSSVPCRKVIISAHESNTGTIVIGASTVVGALAGRRGKALFSTQSEIFEIDNLNKLYFDGTVTGDDIHYTYFN